MKNYISTWVESKLLIVLVAVMISNFFFWNDKYHSSNKMNKNSQVEKVRLSMPYERVLQYGTVD